MHIINILVVCLFNAVFVSASLIMRKIYKMEPFGEN